MPVGDAWHCDMILVPGGKWMKIALTKDQVVAWHVSRIEQDFSRLFLAAGSPPGAALFGVARED